MAVAYDASSESHTGTTPSSSEASFSWTHTPVGTPKGVLVYVLCLGTPADLSTGVTYGGVALTTDAAWFAQDTLNEAGSCRAYYLGTGIPTGAQTVVVTRTNTVDHVYAVAITLTGAGDTEVHTPGVVLLEEDGTLAEQSVTDGSPGTDSLRFAGGSFGHAAVPAAGANSTAVHSIDIGIRVAGVVRETTAGQGSRSVGFSDATSDDRAVVHLAVREVSGGTTYQVTLAGGITPGGGIARTATKVLAAGLTPTGAIVRQTTTALVGAMTPTGAVVPLKTALLALAGALTPTAALVRSATVQLTATLAPAGAVVRAIATSLTGTLAPAGAVVRTLTKLLVGGATPAAGLSSLKVAVLAVAGSLAPTGALLRAVSTHLAGAVAPAGALGRRVTKLFDAALTPVGDLARWVLKSIAGVIVPSGTLGTLKSAVVVLVGALTPSGGLVRRVTKLLDSVVSPLGALITTAIIAAGNLLKLTAGIAIRPALGAAQRIRGPLAAAARALARLRGSPDIGPEA